MSSFYLHIIDFTIKVQLFKPKYTVFLRDKLQREIMMLFRDFVSLEKPKKIDFTIEFQESNIIGLVPHTPTNIQFVSLYEKKGPNKIRTYYSISTSQFHYMVTEILSMLLKDSGFFQHASSVVHHDKAFLFLGKSGSGKTTISSFLKDTYHKLADDLVMIKKEKDQYICFQSPLWERNWWLGKHTESYPLSKIFFLKKSKDCHVEKITNSKEKLKLLLSDLTYEQTHIKEKMGVFMKFVAAFDGFYYLHFPKDKRRVLEFFEEQKILS